MRDFDPRASGRRAKSGERVSLLLEEIEGELEIALLLRRKNMDLHDGDLAWRDRRQGRGLDEPRPDNRAVAGPETAEPQAREFATNRGSAGIFHRNFEA